MRNIFVLVVMCDLRKVGPTVSRPKIETVQKPAPKKYFNLPLMILLLFGIRPINSRHSFILRSLFSIYFWSVYIFIIVLNTISKGIALPYQKNLEDLTDNMSFFINHAIATLKIAIFMIKREDVMRLVEEMEGQNFRHKDCSRAFSANRLIREAVRKSQALYCIFIVCLAGVISNSILNAITERSEEIFISNSTETEESTPQHHRALPFHAWYPFSDQISPNYELVFAYQIVALFIVGLIVLALDALVFSFMIHIKVCINIAKLQGAAYIRYQISKLYFVQTDETANQLAETMELDLGKLIVHQRAIIQMIQHLESVFTYQLLVQFVCSLLAICTLLWQVSSTPVLSAKFASELSHLVATAFQLFIYCWFGNEMMLESLSVADAAWDSGWQEIASRRYCYGVAMIIHRSQKVITITARGFAGLKLETFMMISRGAYSCFAVLKKVGV